MVLLHYLHYFYISLPPPRASTLFKFSFPGSAASVRVFFHTLLASHIILFSISIFSYLTCPRCSSRQHHILFLYTNFHFILENYQILTHYILILPIYLLSSYLLYNSLCSSYFFTLIHFYWHYLLLYFIIFLLYFSLVVSCPRCSSRHLFICRLLPINTTPYISPHC